MSSTTARILSLVVAVLLLGAGPGRWASVARKHVSFAKSLAKEGTRLDPSFIGEADRTVGSTCDAGPQAPPHLRGYAESFCKPWHRTWDDLLKPCNRARAPAWCNDEGAVMGRVSLERYFRVLTKALSGTAAPAERFNLVQVALYALDAPVVAFFAPEDLDRWAAPAVSEYLRSAEAKEALEIARQLHDSLDGPLPGLAGAISGYADRSQEMSPQEKNEMALLAGELSSSEEK